jgi:hypothetical protein
MREMRTYLKSHELARMLLEHPNMKVGIFKKEGYPISPANHVKVVEWDPDFSPCSLIGSEHNGKFLLIEALEVENDDDDSRIT